MVIPTTSTVLIFLLGDVFYIQVLFKAKHKDLPWVRTAEVTPEERVGLVIDRILIDLLEVLCAASQRAEFLTEELNALRTGHLHYAHMSAIHADTGRDEGQLL